MDIAIWFLIVGAVFGLMALSSSYLRRLPLSTSLLYLLVGIGIGPAGLGLLKIDPIADAKLLEHLTEIAVIISLFTCGLKLRAALRDPIWRISLRLAFISMVITVALIAGAGVFGLGLSLGAAVLLGGLLAPTDPVLASDVQVERPTDQDRLRFGLTGEAGLNDGTAFPVVMLGLGLLGLHELGEFGWRWLAVDVAWAILAGLGVGWLLGQVIGRLVVHLRKAHREAIGLDDFLALGLIALSYGAALMIYGYGFLAVFAAGLALRHIELESNAEKEPEVSELDVTSGKKVEELASDEELAPTYMAQAVLGFNEQLERIGEVAMVVLLGAILVPLLPAVPMGAIWFIPLLFLAIRPAAVTIGLLGSQTGPVQRSLISWFGVRGIGSIYYLMYALTHGVEGPLATQLAAIVAVTIAVSILVHGVSVTPLMSRYGKLVERREAQGKGEERAPAA